MPDFKVLRGTSVIGNGDATLTLTEGTDFTLETGIASDAWFFRITNSNHTGQGNTSGGGSRAADLHTVHFTYSGDDVVLTRAATATDCRVTWEIVQYIGASGGANEIKVRDKGTLSLTSGNTLSTLAVPGSVGTAANCVAWVCAQSSSHNTSTRQHSGLYTSRLNGSNFEFERGNGSSTGTVSYAIVEFTGSNWTIQNVQFTQTGSDGTASLGTNVSALSEAFLHNTYRFSNSGNGGLDDCSVLVYLSAVGTLTYDDTTSSSATDKHHSIWVIENSDLSVQRLDFTMAGAGEEEVDTETITAVSDLEQTMLTVDSNSTGTGTAMPRGYIDARLTSTTEVRFTQSDDGQTSRVVAEIIELPTAAGGSNTTLSGDTEGLSLSTQSANLTLQGNLAGEAEALALTPNNAQVLHALLSTLDTEQLSLADQDAELVLQTIVDAATEQLLANANGGTFNLGLISRFDTEQLNLAELDGELIVGVTVSGDTEQVSVSTQTSNMLITHLLAANDELLEVSTVNGVFAAGLVLSGAVSSFNIASLGAKAVQFFNFNAAVSNFTLASVAGSLSETLIMELESTLISVSESDGQLARDTSLLPEVEQLNLDQSDGQFAQDTSLSTDVEQLNLAEFAGEFIRNTLLSTDVEQLSLAGLSALFVLSNASGVRYVAIELSGNELCVTVSENTLELPDSENSLTITIEGGNTIE